VTEEITNTPCRISVKRCVDAVSLLDRKWLAHTPPVRILQKKPLRVEVIQPLRVEVIQPLSARHNRNPCTDTDISNWHRRTGCK